MHYSTYKFTLDIHKTRSQVSIPVMFQDTWVRFLVNLTDGGKPYTLEGVSRVVLYGKKKDGTTLTEDCTIDDTGTRIEYTFSPQTASAIGPVECEFRLYSTTDGLHITSPSFGILVEERVVEDEDLIPSVSNPSAIDRMIESESAREEAESARIANEELRVEAEGKRAEAEAKRVEAEAKRQNLADTIDAKIAGKLDIPKNPGSNKVLVSRWNNAVELWGMQSTPTAGEIVMFSERKTLVTNTATDPSDAVPLAQMNEALEGKADTATFDTLAKKVENLEAGVAPDMFTTDDTTAYIKSIPANAAPYAELRAVGGMIHTHELPAPNLFKASVLDAENNRTYYDEGQNVEPIIYANNGVYTIDQVNYTYGSVIYVTAATVRELFPNAVDGKKYTFSYDAEGESGTGIYFTGGAGDGTFTMTEAILDGHLEMYGAETYDPDGGMYWPTSATYSNISLTEEGGGERYLTEAKVTALDIYGKNLYNGGFGGTACATEENGVLTMVKRAGTGSEDRYTTRYVPPFPLPVATFSANLVENGTTNGVYVTAALDNGSDAHILLCNGGAVGEYSVDISKVANGAKIVNVRVLLTHNEAEGNRVKLTDIAIFPTATPTDTTYSPYHKTTFAIPEAVKAIDGYGWGIPNGAHNGVEWDDEGRATFVKRVERRVYVGTEDWRGDTASVYYLACNETFTGAREGANGVSNKMAWRTPNPCIYTSNSAHRKMSVIPVQYASTEAEWKAQLAAWAAEGDPLTVYYELAEPIITDISHLITEDNLIPVEGGGVIVANIENEEAAPSTIVYQKRGV